VAIRPISSVRGWRLSSGTGSTAGGGRAEGIRAPEGGVGGGERPTA
jgi:hypothetical protein